MDWGAIAGAAGSAFGGEEDSGGGGGGGGKGGGTTSVDTNASAHTTVSSGPFTQGFTFGGINTGQQSTGIPTWMIVAALVAVVLLWKR